MTDCNVDKLVKMSWDAQERREKDLQELVDAIAKLSDEEKKQFFKRINSGRGLRDLIFEVLETSMQEKSHLGVSELFLFLDEIGRGANSVVRNRFCLSAAWYFNVLGYRPNLHPVDAGELVDIEDYVFLRFVRQKYPELLAVSNMRTAEFGRGFTLLHNVCLVYYAGRYIGFEMDSNGERTFFGAPNDKSMRQPDEFSRILCLNEIMETGIDINAQTEWGFTPLSYLLDVTDPKEALRDGSYVEDHEIPLRLMEALLEYGANPDIEMTFPERYWEESESLDQPMKTITPRQIAERDERKEVLKLFDRYAR